MPIYDPSYRPYRGPLSSHAMRWWTITRTGIQYFVSRRLFVALLVASAFYPVIAGFRIYFAHQFPSQNPTPIDAAFFRDMMEIQLLWFLVFSIYPGAGLISNDLRWNAIQLYLSKPLTRLDYVAGKLAILFALLLGVTLVPGLLLFALELGFSSDLTFLKTYWWLPLSIAGYSAVAAASWGMIVLAVSSLSRSGRLAGVMIFALIFLSSAVAGFVYNVFDRSEMIVISVIDELKQISYIFFGGQSQYGDHHLLSAVTLAGLVGASALILRSRVKAVEVVT